MLQLAVLVLALLGSTCAHGPREHYKSEFRVQDLQVHLDPSVTIVANASSFARSRQVVEVSWVGITQPVPSDMVALYVPANATPWRTLPVQFVSCAEADPGHLQAGAGTARFTLLNMRGSFRFALLRGGVVHPRLVAQSAPVWNKIPYHPTGGHIALHEDERSVVVQWVSGSHFPQDLQWGPQEGDKHASQLPQQGRPPAGGGSIQRSSSSSSATQGVASSLRCVVGGYRWTTPSTLASYKASDMCGYPANSTGWLHPGYIHTAIIPSHTLTPGRRYTYRYGADGAGWSDEASFIAPLGPGVAALRKPGSRSRHQHGSVQQTVVPLLAGSGPQGEVKRTSGSRAGLVPRQSQQQQQQQQQEEQLLDQEETPFIFLAFNDVAMTYPLLFNNPGGLHFAADYGENSSHLAHHLAPGGPQSDAHLALLVGDLAYAMGYGADWDMFGDQFEAAFRQWPVMVGTGNHERDWPGTGDAFGGTARDSGGECNVPFMHRWYTPANAKGDPRTSHYSFNQGPVHFIILDSESPSDPDSPQGSFVASDLAKVDRSVTPWVVVALHRMMLAPATWRRKWVGDVENMERLQADYEHLFQQHQVDVVIQGHEHAYARTCPYYQGRCTSGPLSSSSHTTRRTPTTAPAAAAAVRLPHRLSCSLTSPSSTTVHSWLMAAGRYAAVALHKSVSWLQGKETADKKAQQPHSDLQRRIEMRGRTYAAPAGGPVYVLAGHAGAGFTHGFPAQLPQWLECGVQDVNGLLRFTATSGRLCMQAIAAKDGSVMDHFELVKQG